MKTAQDQRKYARFTIPVVVQAPELSDLPLVPEDVSAGGFKVMVTKEPPKKDSIECSIQISEDVFDNCTAHVAWVHKSGETPETWEVGLTIKTLIEDRDFLDITLQKAHNNLR